MNVSKSADDYNVILNQPGRDDDSLAGESFSIPLDEFVVRCKHCGENIPAPVPTMPASSIIVRCLLCASGRRCPPDDIFRLFWKPTKPPQSVGIRNIRQEN